MNLQQLLAGIGNVGQGLASLFGRPGQGGGGLNLGSLLSPQGLLGSGLFAAGGLPGLNRIPGYASDAIQSLRNQFMSPDAIAKQFTGQIGALQSQYQPLIDQQVNTLLNDIQQRAVAGQPTSFSTAMSGPELAAIRTATQNQLLPTIQSHLADIGRFLLGQQTRAAEDLLQFAKPNPLGAAISQLGSSLLGGAGLFDNRQDPLAQALDRLLGTQTPSLGGVTPAPRPTGQLSPEELARQLVLSAGGGGGLDATSLGLGGSPYDQVPSGSTGFGGIDQLISNLAGGGVPGAGTTAGISGTDGGGFFDLLNQIPGMQGLLSGRGLLGAPGVGSLGAVLSGLGSVGAGYGLGRGIGPLLPNQATGALGGAGAGALSGFALGGPVGAVIGALAGGFGGFQGKQKQQRGQKAKTRAADIESQAGQVQEIGTFFTQRLSALGEDTSAFQQLVSSGVSEKLGGGGGTPGQEGIASQGGRLLLAALRRSNPQLTSLNQVPRLRREYIDFLTQNTFTSSGGTPTELIGRTANLAGLQIGGFTTRPTMAMVGERGPEMAMLSPGSMVLPMVGQAPTGMTSQVTSNAQQGVLPLQMVLQMVSPRRRSPLLGGASYV